MGTTTIRVVIADDHPLLRSGLAELLAQTDDIALVGTCAAFAELPAQIVACRPQVVVLDLGGMGPTPLTMVNQLRRDYPTIAVVVYSSTMDLAPELINAGILGYVVKEEAPEQLIHAVQLAGSGRRFLSPKVAQYVEEVRLLGRNVALAPREVQVLALLTSGLATEEIAGQLAIDPRTAQNYITALLRKTGCSGRVQLITWYRGRS